MCCHRKHIFNVLSVRAATVNVMGCQISAIPACTNYTEIIEKLAFILLWIFL